MDPTTSPRPPRAPKSPRRTLFVVAAAVLLLGGMFGVFEFLDNDSVLGDDSLTAVSADVAPTGEDPGTAPPDPTLDATGPAVTTPVDTSSDTPPRPTATSNPDQTYPDTTRRGSTSPSNPVSPTPPTAPTPSTPPTTTEPVHLVAMRLTSQSGSGLGLLPSQAYCTLNWNLILSDGTVIGRSRTFSFAESTTVVTLLSSDPEWGAFPIPLRLESIVVLTPEGRVWAQAC